MYNHYIPQSDGSYRRSTMPENNRRQPGRPQQAGNQPPGPPPQPKQTPPPPPPPAREPPPPEPVPHCPEQPAPLPQCAPRNDSILSFLRGLFPREIDATDLLVILILLLMNQEDGRDSISPMLTIALYFLL